MYREYRDVTLAGAVTHMCKRSSSNCFTALFPSPLNLVAHTWCLSLSRLDRDMAARHSVRARSIQIIRTDVVPSEKTLRKHVQQFHVSLLPSCSPSSRALDLCAVSDAPAHLPLPVAFFRFTELQDPLPAAQPPHQDHVQEDLRAQAPDHLLRLDGWLILKGALSCLLAPYTSGAGSSLQAAVVLE